MLLWKPLLAVVPAGLLLGLVAGQATRPEMLVKDDRAWPYAADEAAHEADRWPSLDLSGPDMAVRGYSFRPAIDYDRYVWPDQTDRSTELLAASYEVDFDQYDAWDASNEERMPITRRATAELSAIAVASAADITQKAAPVAVDSAESTTPDNRYTLPALPPPLTGDEPDDAAELDAEEDSADI